MEYREIDLNMELRAEGTRYNLVAKIRNRKVPVS